MVVCDYRAALRSATAPLHREIDALFGAFDLADRDGLTRFLAAQAIGMQACQPRAMRFGRQNLNRAAPDYLRLLTTDLATLGVDTGRLPRLELSSASADAQGDAGVFYVVAGSRMGTAMLRDRATAPTPDGPASGVCGYFAVGEGPAMWRLFREWLGSEGPKDRKGPPGRAETAPSGLPGMIEAAKATFRLFAEAAQWAAGQPVGAQLTGAPRLPAEQPGSGLLATDAAALVAPAVRPGFTALVVEDNMLIAMDAEEALHELGAGKVQLCQDVAGALVRIRGAPFDVALLDVNLGNETSEAIAMALRAAGTPFIVTTGFGDYVSDIPAFLGAPVLTKPYAPAALLQALAQIIG